jgi:hypothetical protein
MGIGLSGNVASSLIWQKHFKDFSFLICNWSSTDRTANHVPSVCRMVNIIIEITPSSLHSLLFDELPFFLFKSFKPFAELWLWRVVPLSHI